MAPFQRSGCRVEKKRFGKAFCVSEAIDAIEQTRMKQTARAFVDIKFSVTISCTSVAQIVL